MTAQQVVKGEDGDEVLIPLATDGSGAVEQNAALPDYLPEDESPSLEPDKAVTRVGSGQDGSSWLGAATNFLSRSFYW
ncbi:armadillo repeat-containing protein 1-like [Etheostoma cragini]|uniref:armadillo repeat-containing protein 1-like n=1 Tax=Etheostoma cragini TaxID=417921 RepID=UPI00155E151E|nr:armadillo repeat-containing protein 1-like [Etheostoma cragini]